MFIRKLSIIILSLLLLAAGFQLLRSFGILKFVKNINSLEELSQATSPEIPSDIDFEKYLIISDKSDVNSEKTGEQLKIVLNYMKKDFLAINVNDNVDDLSGFDCIFLTCERLDFLKNLKDYTQYANSGGSLVFLIRPVTDKSFESISSLLGIKNYAKDLVTLAGIKVLSDVIIGANGFKSNGKDISNSSLNLELVPGINPILSSSTGTPLLWEKDYGAGKFVVFNGTFLNEKNNRGILAGIIGLGKDNLIYPVINIKMIHIDDFPAPIPEGRDEKIYEEFSRDIPQFYKEVWWPEMIKISKKFDMKYSGFVIESYNDITTQPLPKAGSEDVRNFLIYGKELLGIGGEIGLHGYNHQSLALQGFIKQDLGYRAWASEIDMAVSIKELLRFAKSVFALYSFRAYVPPSNILSPEGRKAIIDANPDLQIIAAVYLPSKEGDEYTQELSIAGDGIIEFPRISSGYDNNAETMWSIYNAVNLYGLFAHFVHPDDVLDPERNKGKSWTQMAKVFSSMIGEINNSYGWLRSATISTAGHELVKYLECKPQTKSKNDEITIYTQNFRQDVYCIIRTKNRIIKSEKCDYLKISDTAYLLTLKEPVCNLKMAVK